MALKNLPLDAAKLGTALCIAVAVKADALTGEIKKDTDGVTQYLVSVAVAPTGQRAALIDVTVSGEPRDLIIGTHVGFRDLEALFWEMNGRSGIAFRAAAVVPAMPPLAPEAAPAAPAAAGRGAAK
ncbi:hypothetical protein ACEZDB_38650 [Streptacidiphilus sp. N1-3]|uniref:Uncharacterized protein n=1 Tax=Streptacidiphilus alkalitolerans TaxID=3342712 RepID=A0ABV6XED7_9ACTN